MKKISPRLEKSERDALRRNEIIAAARQCVIRQGFHAASMAQIAQEASMSVGQIYRYFANKEAIVHAIVEGIVSQKIEWITGIGKTDNLPAILVARIFDSNPEGHDDHILLIEVNAEASRNPVVADMVRRADTILHDRAVESLQVNYPHLDREEARARVEFVASLAEGAAFRNIIPTQTNQKLLADVYHKAITLALSS